MDNKANEITSAQVYIFLISAQVSFGITTLSSSIVEKLGHDGWIAVLLAGLIVCILVSFMMLLLKRFEKLSIMDINIYFFGRYIGNFLNLLIFGYAAYTTIIALRFFDEIISISVLPLTPGLILTCFIFLPVLYLSWYGLKYICRFSVIKPLLLLIIILYFLLISKSFKATFLQPIGISGFKNIIKATYEPYVSYLGFELISIIYPYIKDKNNSYKMMIYGNLSTTLLYVIIIIFLTGFFGENMLMQLQYPMFSLARAYKAPILERLDLFFISLWFPIMEITVLMYFFSAYTVLKKLFKLENNKPKAKILILIFTAIVIGLSRLPKDMIQIKKLFSNVGYIGTVFIGYILLCYIISFIKKPGGIK